MRKAKAKVYKDSDFYTGRAVTIQRAGMFVKTVTGKVGTGMQCGKGNFSFYEPPTGDNPYGNDSCVSRSAIVKLGK